MQTPQAPDSIPDRENTNQRVFLLVDAAQRQHAQPGMQKGPCPQLHLYLFAIAQLQQILILGSRHQGDR
ncbi:hypothetical protein BAE47_14570 [Acidithiobacillus thiooxidans]|uniref:Uncharacterized protein n=1 Tax=Acidithiobacillus thiooxidans TaxID=930 RepID=A0A1C2HUI4_ACITH|nr:hypothetical protein A6M23_20820 [Acidithiobacillus thiooxidans]OCX79253.1 hypothetical protein A6O26_16985 [Acidithiobacillus thiooxidans]OCX79562.1 hypothetical protein A6P08_17670 [Acidithiobacillus thiooxidans]OFC42799.1 hypothetical protein BAE47_14570 [Acidithiobacillus thiooxidans]